VYASIVTEHIYSLSAQIGAYESGKADADVPHTHRGSAAMRQLTASGTSRRMPNKRSGNAEMSDLKMAIGNVIKYSTLAQETYKACKSQMLALYFLHAPLRHTDPFPLCPAQAHCRPSVLTKG